MVNTEKLLNAIQREIKRCIPDVKHHKGQSTEGFLRPAFLYFPTYHKEKLKNAFLREITQEIQVIYCAKRDGYGMEEYEERLQMKERLDSFLSTFRLEVEDRVLTFTYEWKEVDKQDAVYLFFKYLEPISNPEREAAEQQEAAEHVAVNLIVEKQKGV